MTRKEAYQLVIEEVRQLQVQTSVKDNQEWQRWVELEKQLRLVYHLTNPNNSSWSWKK